MAGRPKSGITASSDVNLDFLTKEEREALLSKKMDMIRQRNRMITERHEMIEADRRKAEESGNAVKALDSKTLPAEGAPNKPRGRGRGQGQGAHKDGNRPMKDRPKSHGDASSYEPIVDVSDLSGQRAERTDNRNKGRGQQHLDRDGGGQVSTPKNRRKPHSKDESMHGIVLQARFRQPQAPPIVDFDYEPIVDLNDLDVRFGPRSSSGPNTQSDGGNNRQQGYNSGHARSNRRSDPPQDRSSSKPYEGRLKGDGGPPPDPTFNPLVDRRRGGGGGGGGGSGGQDNRKEERSDYKRHPRNYGGGADLTKVKDSMKTMREKERERPGSNKPLDMVMTGRERRNHEQWKQERERYDNDRIQRQLGDGGHWKREWDHDKVVLEYDDSLYSKMEPAKRPGAGPQQQQQHQPNQSAAPPSHHHPPQQQQHPPSPQHAPLSPQPSPQHGDNKVPRGKGRGRGRGRGRGQSQGAAPGDKSPRPRTWSGGEDNRFVECQKEMLVVKFDNTAGDNTVEVEYDNEAPLSPTPSSKSSGSMPGRGPTGRTPNQGGGSGSRSKGNNKTSNHKQEKFSKGKGGGGGGGSGRIPASHFQQHEPRVHQDQFVDADLDNSVHHSHHQHHHRHSYEGSKVRTSSHSQSHGDSEEWEDCTESSGAPEDEDQNLRLDCQLNPEAPEFLPTSPDFLKTPPGHVKVLNWAGNNSPLSPQSNLSPPSFSSPSPREQDVAANQSPFSSPGSSSSVRAKNRREIMDAMPEPDEPLPPPFLLEAELSGHVKKGGGSVGRMSNGGDADNEEEDDDDDDDDENDRFEDSIDEVTIEVKEKEGVQDAVELPSEEDVAAAPSRSDNQEELNGVLMDEVAESKPISNGHTTHQEDVLSSIPPEIESKEMSEQAQASNPKSGEELLSSETTTVSESVEADGDLKDVDKVSSDHTSDETNNTEEGPVPVLKPDANTDTNSLVDQVISTDNSGSDKGPQPTAENSAES